MPSIDSPPQFIVAELSKNWKNGAEVSESGLISQQFDIPEGTCAKMELTGKLIK